MIADNGPHFSWPPITGSTAEAVLDQLNEGVSIYDRSGIVARLEDALRGYFGTRYAVLTGSGTAALYSMYAACGIGPDDEVIVPAYTFFATVTPLLHLGAVPVLADCDTNGNLDPHDIPRRITENTKAIVVQHMWGNPAQIGSLRSLAEVYGLQLLEDASHAHGAMIGNQRIGTFGRASAFSMNGPKPLSAGEGGFILTDDEQVYYRILLHGQYNKRCREEIPVSFSLSRYSVTGMGLKHRIHPMGAALALEQLGRLDEYLEGRANIAERICAGLEDLDGIVMPHRDTGIRSSWYGLIIRNEEQELGVPPERLYEALKAEGCIEVDRPGSTCPLNLLPLFQEPGPLFPQYERTLNYRPGDFPQAEHVHRTTFKLPVWHRDQDLPIAMRYVDAFRKVIHHVDELKG
nr:DegT/DnrJ/EryC1/StrS family aminotransferase [Nocardia transvalensis]